MNTTEITLTETGAGRPALILHGGGGPATVATISEHLARSWHTLTPTHPGWDGTARPDSIASIPDIAALYLDLLSERELTDALVVGSSLGGWIAAEMAVRDRESGISQLILVDAVGIDVPGEPMTDFFTLDPRGVAEHSFYDSDRFYVDPATLPPDQAAATQANMATMRTLAGDPYMHNPDLEPKLATLTIPALLLWGDSDSICTPTYGKAYARALANARFQLIAQAGHLPHIEQPAATFAAIDSFLARSA